MNNQQENPYIIIINNNNIEIQQLTYKNIISYILLCILPFIILNILYLNNDCAHNNKIVQVYLFINTYTDIFLIVVCIFIYFSHFSITQILIIKNMLLYQYIPAYYIFMTYFMVKITILVENNNECKNTYLYISNIYSICSFFIYLILLKKIREYIYT